MVGGRAGSHQAALTSGPERLIDGGCSVPSALAGDSHFIERNQPGAHRPGLVPGHWSIWPGTRLAGAVVRTQS